MNHPALKNYWSIALYAGAFALLGLTQTAALAPLIDLPLGWLIGDGLVFGLVFGALAIPLWMVVQFVDLSKGNFQQQIINTIALCAITIGSWLGLGLFFLYISFPREYFMQLLPSIPMRVVGGVFLYMAIIQRYGNLISRHKDTEDTDESVPVEENESSETEETEKEIIDRIAVKIGQKIHVIPVNEIFSIQAEGDYVMIHTKDAKYLKEATMKYLEEHLPPTFIRVHRSSIVNVEIISQVELYEKQNYLLILQNGEKIKTSANGYKQLKKVLSL